MQKAFGIDGRGVVTGEGRTESGFSRAVPWSHTIQPGAGGRAESIRGQPRKVAAANS